MSILDHEEVVIRRGSRSGLPVIVAVHSTVLGQAVGGCRIWRYADWRDGVADALLLADAMTRKCAVAGLPNGGGKTVVAVPADAVLDAGRRRDLLLLGLGNVGGRLARLLAAERAELLVSDVDPAKQALATELGATWVGPDEALTADVDILVPAALGGVLTEDVVPALRCAAVAGPANNQLAGPAVADLLHRRKIVWVPDYVVSAGGVIHALSVELRHSTAEEALARVHAVGETVDDVLAAADRTGITPAQAALDLAALRLRGGTPPGLTSRGPTSSVTSRTRASSPGTG
ncbi:amino acid dehydrogenase [Actinomadura sp. HBU206391]|nr:amino acid dehydrogenase [Actinomadura sp. HBU206391]